MVIFSQRWDGNEFFWGYHCYQWFFNCFATTEPLPLNVSSLIDHWHRWFFNGFRKILVRWSTMVLASLKDIKKLTIVINPILWRMYFMMEKQDKWIFGSFQSSHATLQTKSKLFGLLGPHFATIAKFPWFSKAPSPLNGMVWDNHWIQWFFWWFWG